MIANKNLHHERDSFIDRLISFSFFTVDIESRHRPLRRTVCTVVLGYSENAMASVCFLKIYFLGITFCSHVGTRWCTKVTKQQRPIVAICHFCQRGALLCLWPGVVSNKRSLAAGKDSQRLVHRAKIIKKDLWRAATFCTFCALCVQVFFIHQLLLGLSVCKRKSVPKNPV